MRSNTKIYCLFVALALLFWNPLSYSLFYGHTQFIRSREHTVLFWIYAIIFICGILSIYLIYKNKLNNFGKNLIFAIAFTGLLFSGLVLFDWFLSFTSKSNIAKDRNQKGLIFKPNTKARYRTVEFDFVADINNLGLREREFTVDKGGKFRILCFGDSYTFGWGVNIEDGWPRKLERYLHSKGFKDVEVVNCGQGGRYTRYYKKYIQKAVPLLRPDLILVGVSQLDDLAQLFENNFVSSQTKENTNILLDYIRNLKNAITKYFEYSFKNALSLLSHRKSDVVDIRSNWKQSANAAIKNFKHLQKIRFYTLDESVQKLFKSGNLNPGLLDYYIDFPDRSIIFNNPDHPATKFAIREMNRDVEAMKKISDEHKSNLIFINIPRSQFTGHHVIRTPSDVLNSYFEMNNRVDAIYRAIAEKNKLPYIELTAHFTGLRNKSDHFYRYDGHPTKQGYAEIAKYIGEKLIAHETIGKDYNLP